METNQIENLLTEVAAISKQYEKIAALTGENYNIFNILGLTTDEVRTHSAFIGDLLNPQGFHDQKDVFLKLFIEQQIENYKETDLVKKIEGIDYEKCELTIEKYIGGVSDDFSEGGRIDIYIKQGDKVIIIENKIYAGDQEKQLVRYFKYNNDAAIFYLTLFGEVPSKQSIEKGNNNHLKNEEDFVCISYKEDILKWLEQCKEKAVNHAMLRETITQYIYLIKRLTNQTINHEMSKEVKMSIISSGNNISAAIEISKAINDAKLILLKRFAKQLKNKLLSLSLDINVDFSENFGSQYERLTIKLPNNENEYIVLSLLHDLREFYFEIVNTGNNNNVNNKKSENINFYKKYNLSKFHNWGKIENVDKAWHGDWVCRYTKLDKYLDDNLFWKELVENQRMAIVDEVCIDISILINILKEKISEHPNV